MSFLEDNTQFFNGFYIGKVEENNDEEKRGRVQVRVVGIHTDEVSDDPTVDGIPIEHLPWAEQCAPIFGGFSEKKAGIQTVPEIGSYVYVFFLNDDHNKPVYFGSVVGSNDLNYIDDDNPDDISTIQTKSGHKLTINDKEDEESIILEEMNGNIVTINSDGILIEEANGNTITMDENGYILEDTNKNKITTSSDGVEIEDLQANKLISNSDGLKLETPITSASIKADGIIELNNTATKIEMSGANVTIGVKGNFSLVRGEILESILNLLVTNYDTHVHNYIPPLIPAPSAAPTIPGTLPPLAPQLQSLISQLKSTLHKIDG